YRVHFEVRSSGCLNILLANGKRFSYECKVNKLQTTEIIDGKKQANKYRKAVKAEEMCLVNFIPEGHQMDEEMFPSEYPKVHVVHIIHDRQCTKFQLCSTKDQWMNIKSAVN